MDAFKIHNISCRKLFPDCFLRFQNSCTRTYNLVPNATAINIYR